LIFVDLLKNSHRKLEIVNEVFLGAFWKLHVYIRKIDVKEKVKRNGILEHSECHWQDKHSNLNENDQTL